MEDQTCGEPSCGRPTARAWLGLGAIVLLACCGCGNTTGAPSDAVSPPAEASVRTVDNLGELEVLDLEKGLVPLASFFGEQNVIVMFSRGYSGSVCPYCVVQFQEIAARHAELAQRDARVVVVFPVRQSNEQQRWEELRREVLEKAPELVDLPFPVLIDAELKAVDKLGIREMLARPSTYIVDKNGKERYAYVGRDPADRPSFDALLKQLDAIQ